MAKTVSAVADGFVSLFNGRDLAGWQTHPAQPDGWSVQGGILVGNGPSVSHLFTDRDDFTDVHVKADARINAAGNSGIYVRTNYGLASPAVNPKFPSGYEAQICPAGQRGNGKTGSLYYDWNRSISATDATAPAGDWFTIEEIVKGNDIRVVVNGKESAHYVDSDRRFTKGRIALQLHNSATKVEFRKIQVKRL